MRKLILLVIVLSMLCSNAIAYTFDGDFDPKNIFTYQVVEMESLGGNRVLATLKGNNPQFIVACLMQTQQGIMILAYAYYDKDMNLRHFMFDGIEHYKEGIPDATTAESLKQKLNLLHKFKNI